VRGSKISYNETQQQPARISRKLRISDLGSPSYEHASESKFLNVPIRNGVQYSNSRRVSSRIIDAKSIPCPDISFLAADNRAPSITASNHSGVDNGPLSVVNKARRPGQAPHSASSRAASSRAASFASGEQKPLPSWDWTVSNLGSYRARGNKSYGGIQPADEQQPIPIGNQASALARLNENINNRSVSYLVPPPAATSNRRPRSHSTIHGFPGAQQQHRPAIPNFLATVTPSTDDLGTRFQGSVGFSVPGDRSTTPFNPAPRSPFL
jgi:hypothetical protein